MNLEGLLHNHVSINRTGGWFLAQGLKIPIDVFQSHHWNWALFFAAGGMPSSHSALVTSTAAAVGIALWFRRPALCRGSRHRHGSGLRRHRHPPAGRHAGSKDQYFGRGTPAGPPYFAGTSAGSAWTYASGSAGRSLIGNFRSRWGCG